MNSEPSEFSEPNNIISSQKTLSLNVLNFIQGEQFTIEPNNYYILEFWATWCPPCVKSIPHLNELYLKYKDKINFVGITSGDSNKIVQFVQSKKEIMTYPVAIDVDSVLHDELKIKGIPALFIIDGNSNIIWNGHPMDDEVEKQLNNLFQLN